MNFSSHPSNLVRYLWTLLCILDLFLVMIKLMNELPLFSVWIFIVFTLSLLCRLSVFINYSFSWYEYWMWFIKLVVGCLPDDILLCASNMPHNLHTLDGSGCIRIVMPCAHLCSAARGWLSQCAIDHRHIEFAPIYFVWCVPLRHDRSTIYLRCLLRCTHHTTISAKANSLIIVSISRLLDPLPFEQLPSLNLYWAPIQPMVGSLC